jgi:long-chain acyl-CoA synthetase
MADDTLAKLFWSRIEKSGDKPAQMFKQGGTWKTLTWRQVGDTVRELALGLIALGRSKGDTIALLSTSRAEWVQADFAIFSAGCATVPIYPTYPPDLAAYIINDSGARTVFVEDAAQLAKVLEARDRCPQLEHIIVMAGYEATQPPKSVMTWETLRRLGRDKAEAHKSTLSERVTMTQPGDLATIVYTSGTTGPPKGVMQTHGNHIAAQTAGQRSTPVMEGWVHLLFLPLAHSFARLESFLGVYHGLTTAFAENLDKLRDNLVEVRPHFICSVPRVFEKVYAGVLANAQSGSPVKQKVFNWAVAVGRDVSRHQQRGQPVPFALELKRKLAHKLVFSKLHARLGGRLQWAISGGAPLSRDIAEFFHAAGILILEGYGLTETCPVGTFNRPDRFKFGSVGQALDGVELKIAADGEILFRGPNIAKGYFKQPQATAEVFEGGGWFHTGDIGRVDEEGFLFITDRKKDLIVTAGGMNIAPQNIENMLKADPFISQVMVHGDRRPYPVALITLNPDELSKFAREHGVLTTDPSALVKHPKILERVGRTVEEKNTNLQSYAKIKKFVILPADFTQEGGELTPTLKVKRKVVSEKYKKELEGLYG